MVRALESDLEVPGLNPYFAPKVGGIGPLVPSQPSRPHKLVVKMNGEGRIMYASLQEGWDKNILTGFCICIFTARKFCKWLVWFEVASIRDWRGGGMLSGHDWLDCLSTPRAGWHFLRLASGKEHLFHGIMTSSVPVLEAPKLGQLQTYYRVLGRFYQMCRRMTSQNNLVVVGDA